MNGFFTSKIGVPDFAQEILRLRRDFEDEIDRLVNYKQIGAISTQTLMERTNSSVEKYDRLFIDAFNSLSMANRIELISNWVEFNNFAEQGLFEDSEILLAAARIVR